MFSDWTSGSKVRTPALGPSQEAWRVRILALGGGGPQFEGILDDREALSHVSRAVKTLFIAIASGRRETGVRLPDLGHVAM